MCDKGTGVLESDTDLGFGIGTLFQWQELFESDHLNEITINTT